MGEKAKGIEIRFGDLWSILKRCWWMMLAVLVLVFSVMYIVETVSYEEEYTATATVWALGSNSSGSNGSIYSTDVTIASALINDYKVLLMSDSLLLDVINTEAPTLTIDELRSMIHISNESDTRVLELSVTAKDPQRAKDIADCLQDKFVTRINSVNEDENPLVREWNEALLPTQPSNSVSVLKIGLIAALCAIVVYLVFFVLYILDDKISTSDDVEKYLGVSMLGIIPNRQDVMRRKRSRAYYGYDQQQGDAKSQSFRQGGKS
ncbi:MAG: hypothetical protein IJW30_05500 [Clostridia bacterium]|nr:hypothetical protein [Clostridia bacterium]